jgi:hypothetical protein
MLGVLSSRNLDDLDPENRQEASGKVYQWISIISLHVILTSVYRWFQAKHYEIGRISLFLK